jgi:PIN domain nuclease of toxin-antitoxin system
LCPILQIASELNQSNPAFEIVPLDYNVANAMRKVSRDAVLDMPDRIIAATSLCLTLPLITRDARIQSVGIKTIW